MYICVIKKEQRIVPIIVRQSRPAHMTMQECTIEERSWHEVIYLTTISTRADTTASILELAIDDRTPCIIGRLYSTCRLVQWMLLRAYGRSVLVYEMYQVSFPRDVYRQSGVLLKWGSENINNRQRSDSRCYSLIIEQPAAKLCLPNTPTYCLSSHQEHRAFCLRCLAELACKPAGSRPLL